jgi:hypothetical protein
VPATEHLEDYLEEGDPYPSLNLLESAVVCAGRRSGKALPEPLMEDLYATFGRERMEAERKNLATMGILRGTEEGFALCPEFEEPVSGLLDRLKGNMRLTLAGGEVTAGAFLGRLASYLQEEVSGLILTEMLRSGGFAARWQEREYRVEPAFSPAWLPAVAEEAAEEGRFLALIGPFAALGWQTMIKYYAYPPFRRFTAYFDPWHLATMNISRGGLFTYFDWFFRDVYGLKFFIPEEFSRALHDMGLLRWNDER